MKIPELKGKIEVVTDPEGLVAKLIFTPGAEAAPADAVPKLFSSAGVTDGIDSRKVEAALKAFSQAGKSSEKLSAEVARGVPPVPPVAEEYEWALKPVPDELKDEAERVLSRASQPEITRVRVEKEKIEKKVLKKPKLPFGQAKEEIVVEYQKREIKERIPVDPTVLETGWAEAEERIAVVLPPKPGKPGRSVLGRPIMPENPPESSMYEGEGVKRGRGELTAAVSGFVRRGANWIDVVPFTRHLWEVKLSKDKATILLDFTPGSPVATVPDAGKILEAASALGASGGAILSLGDIAALAADFVRGGKPVADYPLSGDSDAEYSIAVSEDKLTAALFVRKGRGRGKPLALKEVGSLIQKSGLKGLDFNKIKEDLLAFYRSADTEMRDYVLAQGTAPKEPEKRKITFTVPFLPQKEVEEIKGRALDLPSGTFSGIASIDEFPVSSVEAMALVKKGDALAALSAQVKTEPGKDVFGNILQPSGSAVPLLEALENVKLEKDTLIALCDGLAEKMTRDETVCIRVRPHEDAVVEVSLSPDRMEASLSLRRSSGTGSPLSVEEVNAAVEKAGVVKGIDSGVVSEAILNANEGKEIRELVFARGVSPLASGASSVSFKIPLASGKGVTIGRDGKADFRNQDRITPIAEGTLIAEILSPDIEEQDGWDVTGKVLAAKGGPPPSIECGKNIRKEEIGTTVKLIASKSGELFYDGRLIDVNETHTVQGNIDLKAGNIKFPGTVKVSGSVLAGFYVLSGGDIVIMEGIEASLLSAQGSIFIGQGVKGAGKAVVRAKGEIRLSFAEQATLLAVGDVRIKNACLRCQVKSNGKLILETDKGNFVGGVARVRGGLEAMNLGGESGSKTEVSFGQDYLIKDQIEAEESEIEKVKTQIVKIDSAMHIFEKEGQRLNLEKARQEKLKLLKVIEKRSVRLFTLREKFEEHYPGDVRVRGTVYPGTVIESHGRFHEVKKKSTKVMFSFNPEVGHIQEKPLDQK